ncbi:hypothetical protein [Leptospira kmetyi]|uniref:Uncharacterized protein n=1 Tax=Leptospira kmetyi TaxID=408139 RepID=A0ABX4N7E2_9LEPT|nr:hypothetical protein [Leptospira kmetyi]PJZ29110.1 hypothetical protein CH378_14585 [Leptospira kmetyi]PJZ39723.1 hypothetical protein CH370_19930 [Leptospira kmetyi]
MDEFSNLKEIKDENLHGVLGYIASILLFLSQFVLWLLKKWKDTFPKKENSKYEVASPYFLSVGEVSRLDIFLKKNLSVASSEVLFQDLVSLYKLARERKLESIKIELAHFGTVSHAAALAFRRFLDFVAEFNGLRLVIKFPTNSQDAVKLYLDLQKHRSNSDGGRIELYLNDYSEIHKKTIT